LVAAVAPAEVAALAVVALVVAVVLVPEGALRAIPTLLADLAADRVSNSRPLAQS
jgi:hypothetical protein